MLLWTNILLFTWCVGTWQDWYSVAKIEAEEMALEYGKKNGLHVLTICPGIVFGPMLQTVEINTSSKVLLYMIKGSPF